MVEAAVWRFDEAVCWLCGADLDLFQVGLYMPALRADYTSAEHRAFAVLGVLKLEVAAGLAKANGARELVKKEVLLTWARKKGLDVFDKRESADEKRNRIAAVMCEKDPDLKKRPKADIKVRLQQSDRIFMSDFPGWWTRQTLFPKSSGGKPPKRK